MGTGRGKWEPRLVIAWVPHKHTGNKGTFALAAIKAAPIWAP